MSNVSKRRREGTKPRIKSIGDHKEFLKRITKSLYYGKLPSLPCLSLPVTEISADVFSEVHRGRSLKRLHLDDAAEITRNACVSPCSLVLAILYLERLKTCNPEYLEKVAPSELFLVSLMVSNKFLQDDGEEDEVFCDEWATSGNIDISTLKQLEWTFLDAIDWKIFISEQSFEAGLSWLEKQVALKQAHLRGFFTYADLCATSDININEAIKSFSSACLAITLSYITSLITLVTSTLLISQACMPSLYCGGLTLGSNSIDIASDILPTSEIIDTDLGIATNETIDELLLIETLLERQDSFLTNPDRKLTCCSKWSDFEGFSLSKPAWLDSVFINNIQTAYNRWWSDTSVLNWLYQISLITPLHKWLEKADVIGNLIKSEILNYTEEPFARTETCTYVFKKNIEPVMRCEKPWPNFNKLMVVSFSDR